MDAMSSLSIAAAVIQFVDFGTRLISDSRQIYRSPSGQTAKVVQLSTISNDLALLAKEVTQNVSLPQKEKSLVFYGQLLKICGECKELNAELQKALRQLRGSTHHNRSNNSDRDIDQTDEHMCFFAALKGIWKQDKIESLTQKVKDLRERMLIAMLTCVWDNAKSSQERELCFSSKLDDMITMLNDVISSQRKPFDELEDRVSKSRLSKEIVALIGPDSQVRREMVKVLWDPKWDITLALAMPPPNDMLAQESKSLFCDLISKGLSFTAIKTREDAVQSAYESTYQWIFTDSPGYANGKELWSSFPTWLEADCNDIYWITGKPGSGKSTLVKYIVRHKRVQEHLSRWCQGKKLLLTSYYAWNVGSDDLQKSSEGLMRTLLYQASRYLPYLIPLLAPRHWALLNILRNSEVQAPEWETGEIETSLLALFAECDRKLKLAVFIDGLDEFQVAPIQVLELTRKIASFPGVKVCVASRSWAEFEDALGHGPMLRTHRLTERDIEIFVAGRLGANKGFQELKAVSSGNAEQLLKDVAAKAQGLFLWVALVIGALLEGLTEGDRWSDLQDIVRGIPNDITKLYSHIWSRIKPRNLPRSSEMLQLFRAQIRPLNYISLWLTDEPEAISFNLYAMTDEKKREVKALMERRLISQTRGVLEILPDNTVSFLHRSARDWAFQADVWDMVCAAAPNFDPYPPLLRTKAVTLISAPSLVGGLSGGQAYCKEFFLDLLEGIYYASEMNYSTCDVPSLLNTLDAIERRTLYVSGHRGHIHPELSILTSIESHLPHNTFLGLTAQFSILPYIETKVQAADCKSLLLRKSSKLFVSILENAILGHECLPVEARKIIDNGSHTEISRRLETVQYLLDNEAGSRVVVYEKVRKLRESRKSRFGLKAGEVEYLDEILNLLKDSQPRGLFKSVGVRFGRRRG